MSADYPNKPYEIDHDAAPEARLHNGKPGWLQLLAFLESALGSVLIVLAALMTYLTAAFLVWAVREGNVPLLGMFMAASIRAGTAFTLGVLGLLLLWAARTLRISASTNEVVNARAAGHAHRVLLVVCVAFFLLLFGAIVAFFIALGLSNM